MLFQPEAHEALAGGPWRAERGRTGRDEGCEWMWGSPGTILAGRELWLDVTASIEWLHGRRDTEGLWTQQLPGHSTRYLGPAHGFAGCVLALGDVAAVSETLRRFAVEG